MIYYKEKNKISLCVRHASEDHHKRKDLLKICVKLVIDVKEWSATLKLVKVIKKQNTKSF
jgi:uncharacterized protein HemY